MESFCEKHDIEIYNLDDVHSTTRFRSSHPQDKQINIEKYFRVEIFLTINDKQFQKSNNIFNEQVIDLLALNCALTPDDNYTVFNFDNISTLVEKYYSMDFNE